MQLDRNAGSGRVTLGTGDYWSGLINDQNSIRPGILLFENETGYCHQVICCLGTFFVGYLQIL